MPQSMGVFVRSGGGVYHESGARPPTPMRVYLLLAFIAVCMLSIVAVSVTHTRAAVAIARPRRDLTPNRTLDALRNSTI